MAWGRSWPASSSGTPVTFADSPAATTASYAGVAPVELSSGGRTVHRLSRRGNRQLNHAIHMVAICQIRQTNSQGRSYFEKKVAEGRTKREAVRSLKRHV